MNFGTFSFSRLLTAGICLSLLTMIATSCHKDDEQAPPPTIPVVTTAAITNITTDGATGGGSIVSDGGATVTASGIVWSKTNATPTLADSVIAGTTSSGTFTSEISGLEFNTSYYVRAFATNSVGTGYGEVVTLNTVNDTNKVKFTYNGEEVVYGIIVSPTTGRKWLDRNLGAHQVATAFDDYKAYGDLFQWGRPDDGHQLIDWTSSSAGTPVNGITSTLATSDIPEHNNFIIPPSPAIDPSTKRDWRDDNNRNRWATIPQGPCPAGWHVATKDEWMAETSADNGGTATSGGIIDMNSAYNKLKLTVAGYRAELTTLFVTAGQLSTSIGSRGFYWSSTDRISPDVYTDARDFEFGSDYVQPSTQPKAKGACVRCIKDL